jgi:hypothetical protein
VANPPLILIVIGIGISILGSVLVVIASQSRPLDKKRRSESRRPHQEIRELLEDDGPRIPAPTVVLVVGLLCILAGVCWRSLREFR